jgi:hypothetical protein
MEGIEFKYNDVVHDISYPSPVGPIYEDVPGRTQTIYKDGRCVGRVWYIRDGGIESAEIEKEFRGQGIYRAALLDCLLKYGHGLLSFARNRDSDRFWQSFKNRVPEGVEIIEKQEGHDVYYILQKVE